METYSTHIMPVGGMSTWTPNNREKPLPPQPRRMPGRPKKKRRRAYHEVLVTKKPKKIPNKGGRPTKGQSSGSRGEASAPRNVGSRGEESVPRSASSRGQATISKNGQPVAQASVEVGGDSRGQAKVSVDAGGGYAACVNLSGGVMRGKKAADTLNPNETEFVNTTPITTQESQISPVRITPKPKWTRCRILQDKSPMKATSVGPSNRYEDNVVIGSYSVLTKASASLGVTSTGFQKMKTQGGRDSIPVPIWPKDVPPPSASEDLANKQKALEAMRKRAAVDGKKRTVDAVKRMLEKNASKQTDGGPSTCVNIEGSSVVASQPLMRKVGGANKQVRSQPLPVRVRAPSERIMRKKIAK
uniref:uncharacterized protein LOC122610602 n=1 Tax=Erigeron canadensis TaxID=72917 RepID=UPI001CB95AD6|nr:uncharacterized protein LOC122610602 [Erigeron canadensis]